MIPLEGACLMEGKVGELKDSVSKNLLLIKLLLPSVFLIKRNCTQIIHSTNSDHRFQRQQAKDDDDTNTWEFILRLQIDGTSRKSTNKQSKSFDIDISLNNLTRCSGVTFSE